MGGRGGNVKEIGTSSDNKRWKVTPDSLSVNDQVLLEKFWNVSVLHLVPWEFHDSYTVVTTLRKLTVYVVKAII